MAKKKNIPSELRKETGKHIRGNHVKKETQLDESTSGFIDVTTAIKNYILNQIKPRIEDNGQIIDVPLVYANPERWKSVRADGFYRSKEGHILSPIIVFRRGNIQKNMALSVPMDANNPMNVMVTSSTYSAKQKYDKFSILNNTKRSIEYHHTIVPNYKIITYNFIMWVDLLEDADKLMEAFSYADRSYWGIDESSTYLVSVGDFSDAVEINEGEDRIIKVEFEITVNAAIYANTYQKEINRPSDRSNSPATIVVNERIIDKATGKNIIESHSNGSINSLHPVRIMDTAGNVLALIYTSGDVTISNTIVRDLEGNVFVQVLAQGEYTLPGIYTIDGGVSIDDFDLINGLLDGGNA